MDWKSLELPEGARLNKVHHFTFMLKGQMYQLEIDEMNDGSFAGHGEHSSDKNFVLASVNGSSMAKCLEQLVKDIKGRS